MIVLDGSALFAILLDEPEAQRCAAVLENADTLLLSAGSLTELLIVAGGKGVLEVTEAFVEALEPNVLPVTEERARLAARAHRRWGRKFNEAKLNFGDCCAYALAKEHDCPLLFVGNDFASTDIVSALGSELASTTP